MFTYRPQSPADDNHNILNKKIAVKGFFNISLNFFKNFLSILKRVFSCHFGNYLPIIIG